MRKFLRRTGTVEGYTAGGYSHWCPAYEGMHAFAVYAPQRNGAQWLFDGNVDSPTFSPSKNIRVGPYPDDDEGKKGRTDVCHYFLRAGQIQFLGDCTHAMAGQTVPLPELPARYR
ncbi:DUF6527 family protein [Tardiphaga sp.]|uniref:DUF6527 family protein n=1 Tax=Tardiphaga sp. TaxID=1926292 RepID=UPI002613ABC1|nr:DUF6527 family protein [Tardiphaga sp.]